MNLTTTNNTLLDIDLYKAEEASFNKSAQKVAVVIPCYGVANHILSVISQANDYADYIIAVNDCSIDHTGVILKKLVKFFPNLIYIEHEHNQGVGGAVISGFKEAIKLQCSIIIKLDGDGQMDVGYIPALIKPILAGSVDFTKGNRFRNYRTIKKMPLTRRIGNLGLSFLTKAASGYWNIFDPTNGFFAISTQHAAMLDFEKLHKRFFFESSLLIELYHIDAIIEDIPMDAMYGTETSNLSVWKSFREFPPKLLTGWLKRILFKYFLYDFNIASLYLLCGLPLLSFGLWYGISNFFKYRSLDLPAPTGTVVIPTLMITLGFQLLLAAVNYDITNYPKKRN